MKRQVKNDQRERPVERPVERRMKYGPPKSLVDLSWQQTCLLHGLLGLLGHYNVRISTCVCEHLAQSVSECSRCTLLSETAWRRHGEDHARMRLEILTVTLECMHGQLRRLQYEFAYLLDRVTSLRSTARQIGRCGQAPQSSMLRLRQHSAICDLMQQHHDAGRYE